MPIFRYTEQPGNYYAYLIEGHGDDANDGLTPETAVATLDRLVEILDTYAGASRRHAVIVKKRIYNEGITYARNSAKPITFEFVGGCEIDGSGGAKLQSMVVNDQFYNCTIINYLDISVATSFLGYFANGNLAIFRNCKIKGSSIIGAVSGGAVTGGCVLEYQNCIIEESQLNAQKNEAFSSWRTNIERCVVIGNNRIVSSNGAARICDAKNTIFTSGTNIPTSYTLLIFDYNNIYNAVFANTDHAGLQALGYNLNGISANPQLTDPTNGQYTVNQSSPCLYRGEGGEHIGIGEGFYLQANILYFQQAAINNFQLTTGRLGFIDPLDNAFIETNPIDIGQIITLESAELAAILPTVAGEFTAGSVSYSHWYPAYSAASTYHKGAGVTDSAILYRSLMDNNLNNTPASSATEWERLTWLTGVSYAAGKIVQYTDDKWYKANTATSTSWVSGEWDEVVMIREWNLQVKTGRTYDECDAADWATIPYNTTPYLDTAGLGNSDDEYDTSTGEVMVFRFIAVRIDAKTIV